MKTKILLLIIGVFLILGVTALSFTDVTKDKFKEKKYKMDTKTICDKEKDMKEWKDKKILFIKVGEYQDLRCVEDYLDKPHEKIIDKKLIKESKKLGMVMISNE